MKKLTTGFLSLFLLLASCGPTNETAVSDNANPISQPALTATLPPVTITAQLPDPTGDPADGHDHSDGHDHPTEPLNPTALPPTATAIPASATATPVPNIPGGLIQVTMQSRVGVLLDEFPPTMRDNVATAVLNQSSSIWQDRAARQIRLTRLRLNFRDFVYPGKGQLPLPIPDLWDIQLDPAGPARQTIDGHDLVTINYTFATAILTDAASPGLVEPTLDAIGGIWQEPFIFPIDPDQLLQRTGNACVNEGGFPPDSYDAVNIWHLYDFDCEADDGGALGCHRTTLPTFSCLDALRFTTGLVVTEINFERMAWDEILANQVRVGPVTQLNDPDLQVVGDDLDINRIIYRYVEADDCAIDEGVVGGTGWRRLLQFDATVYNVGGETLHVGLVATEDTEHNVFEYNGCHDHFHYSHYGDFFMQNEDELTNSKQAFCVQSTNRLSNNETSPLHHDYSCRFQGIQAGWVDEYIAGLDGQWIDITEFTPPDAGKVIELGFSSNGDQFLCEGEPVLDENGAPLWEETSFTTLFGETIDRPVCTFIENWNNNNVAMREVFVPQVGSYVTAPCTADQVGPLRNCDFTDLILSGEEELACTPGQLELINLELDATAASQVIRVCERSGVLGIGVACPYEESIANVMVGGGAETAVLSFTCPRIRDAATAAAAQGGYALYIAPVWPQDALASVRQID